jgi:hypothetical protein
MNKHESSKQSKSKKKREEIIAKLILIEQEHREADISVNAWATEILKNSSLKLIPKLVKGMFDIKQSTQRILVSYHCIRILLIINEQETLRQLKSNEDLENRLITYIRDTERENIYQDSIFILCSLFDNPNHFKDFYTFTFISGLFDILNYIEDDLIFRATVKILIEINSIYNNIKDNEFVKVYHTNKNARVFNEILLRLLNTESNKDRIIKMYRCFNNVIQKEDSCVLYNNDFEAFVDVFLRQLQTTDSEEIKFNIMDVVEKLLSYPTYYKSLYKLEEIKYVFNDYEQRDSESTEVKNKARAILDTIAKNVEKVNAGEISNS